MGIVPFRRQLARRYYHRCFRRTPPARHHAAMRRTGRSRRRGGLLAAAAALGALALAAVAGRLARLEPMLVQGESMRPTLVPGQRIAVGPLDRPPARGDLVVLPRPSGLEVVKRVVGLPGERVRLAGGRIEVDGRVLHEPYLEGGGGDRLDLRLGPAEYLVLGDNRAASSDGRDFGPVPGDAFVGRVRFAYWPPRRVYRRPRPVHPPP
jgi:signal peptidase I